MLKYELIPRVVFAQQYFKNTEVEGVKMSDPAHYSGHWSDRLIEVPAVSTPYIEHPLTKHILYLKEGDWVIKDESGHFHMLSDHEFKEKYRLTQS